MEGKGRELSSTYPADTEERTSMTAYEGGAVLEAGCKVAGGGSRKSIHVKAG